MGTHHMASPIELRYPKSKIIVRTLYQLFSDDGFRFSTMGSALDRKHIWLVPAYRFAMGKSGSRCLIEKPVENVNEWQYVPFGNMPREDFELFDLSM